MHTYKLSFSATSSATYYYTNAVDLDRKWMDQKNLYIKLDVKGTAISASTIGLIVQIAETTSATTWATVTCPSGTSRLVTGALWNGGPAANGSYLLPIISTDGGTSIALRGVPALRIGITSQSAVPAMDMRLLVG